jgi:hypothetical protein
MLRVASLGVGDNLLRSRMPGDDCAEFDLAQPDFAMISGDEPRAPGLEREQLFQRGQSTR